MPREIVTPGDGRRALGPYSVAVKANGLVFCAGQLGIDFGTGGLVAGGIEAETRQALANLAGTLADAGAGLGDVVTATLYLADIAEWPLVNPIWAETFGTDAPPARTAVAVADLPLAARIEITAIAAP